MNIHQILEYYSRKGEKIDHLLPGEIYLNNFQMTINLASESEKDWKKAIKLNYKTVIIGSQKTTTNLNMKVKHYSDIC